MNFLREFFEVIVMTMPCMLLLGLLLGSLANVVVFRSPRIDRRLAWLGMTDLCASREAWNMAFGPVPRPAVLDDAAKTVEGALSEAAPVSLWHPPSACPACSRQIRWYENIPVASWLWLRAKCAGCGVPIAIRYPLVELTVMTIFGIMTYRLGPHYPLFGWVYFGASMVVLGLIDLDAKLQPGRMTLGLMWAGLLVSAVGWTVPTSVAVTGAALGYLLMAGVGHIARTVLRASWPPGAGVKMMAALGAWFGHPTLVVAALLMGLLLAGTVATVRSLSGRRAALPIGSSLALAGLAVGLAGPRWLFSMFP